MMRALELENVTEERDQLCLGSAVARLLRTLQPEQATRFSKKMAFHLCSRFDANALTPFGGSINQSEILDALLTSASRPEVSLGSRALTTAVGLAGGSPFASLPTLPTASEPLPCRLSDQDLVDLLKMPTCFAEARQVVLKHLGNRYGRTFANHWEFVRYAHEQHLDLDLTSPPKRPSRP
jgi:hypothetical protein